MTRSCSQMFCLAFLVLLSTGDVLAQRTTSSTIGLFIAGYQPIEPSMLRQQPSTAYNGEAEALPYALNGLGFGIAAGGGLIQKSPMGELSSWVYQVSYMQWHTVTPLVNGSVRVGEYEAILRRLYASSGPHFHFLRPVRGGFRPYIGPELSYSLFVSEFARLGSSSYTTETAYLHRFGAACSVGSEYRLSDAVIFDLALRGEAPNLLLRQDRGITTSSNQPLLLDPETGKEPVIIQAVLQFGILISL